MYACIYEYVYAYVDAQNHFDNSNNDKRRENSDKNSIDSKKRSGILDDIPIWVTMLGNVHVLSAPRLFSPSLSVSPFGYLSIRIKTVVQASVVCWVNIGNVTSSMLCWAANGGYLTCFFLRENNDKAAE